MADIAGGGFKPLSNGMRPLQPQQPNVEEKFRQVSDLYEKHFMREMMKAMRSTVHEGGFIKSNQAEKIFKEKLDEEYVEKWGARGGIGLSDLIYNQLMEKFGEKMGLRAPATKPHGPLPIDAKSEYTARSFQPPGKRDAVSFKIEKNLGEQNHEQNQQKLEPQEIRAPWRGTLLNKIALGGDENLLEIGHDNGLKSQLSFRGSLGRLNLGQELQDGQTLGLLSPEAKSFFWTVQAQGPNSQAIEKTVSE